MQRAGKEAAIVLCIADIYDADIDQRACEDRLNSPARDRIDAVERVIDHHPSRPSQDDPGKSHALLLIVVQLPVPSVGLAEQGLEAVEANIRKRLGDHRIIRGVSGVWIGDRGAQNARRDIRMGWYEGNGLASRASDPAASPRPKPADRAEEQCFPHAAFTHNEDMFARPKVQMRLA